MGYPVRKSLIMARNYRLLTFIQREAPNALLDSIIIFIFILNKYYIAFVFVF